MVALQSVAGLPRRGIFNPSRGPLCPPLEPRAGPCPQLPQASSFICYLLACSVGVKVVQCVTTVWSYSAYSTGCTCLSNFLYMCG